MRPQVSRKPAIALLTVSIFLSIAIHCNAADSETTRLPKGYYIIELNMSYANMQDTLKRNGFVIKSRGRFGEAITYESSRPIQQYNFIDKLQYKFNKGGRFYIEDYVYSFKVIEPYFRKDYGYYERLWCLFPNMFSGKFNIDEMGISFMPSVHSSPNSKCKYSSDYAGNIINFPIMASDKLISFETIIYVKENYREGFARTFIDNFSEKYGAPNAEIARCFLKNCNYWIADASWYDKDTFITIIRENGKNSALRIFYRSIHHDDLVSKLKELEAIGAASKRQCEERREQKIDKSIKLE